MNYLSTAKFWVEIFKGRYGRELWKIITPTEIIGRITQEKGTWRKPPEYYSVSVTTNPERGSEYIGSANSLPEARQKFAAWYEEHASEPPKKKATRVAALPGGIDTQFYPTPDKLAGKMIAKIRRLDYVRTILEPSAGKGDLIDCLTKYWNHRWRHRESDVNERVDAIEIDENLRFLLKGKGYRVVADDFLEFETRKHYDLILMNPPFANGDAHLMKAIQMQRELGGQIVCLLNAETLRNPYTNLRHLLVEILSEHEASIEYVKDAFKHAERKADVNVAIVHVVLPGRTRDSFIFDRLKKAQDKKYSTDYEVRDLVAGDWMEQMVRCYELEASLGIGLIQEYNRLSPYIQVKTGENGSMIGLRIGDKDYCCGIGSDGINGFLRICRAKYWRMLLDREELTSRMTSSMRQAYHSKIDKLRDYDFDRRNIQEVFFEVTGQLQDGVKESIMWLFGELSSEHSWYPECSKNRHYFNGWATNKAHKVGMKAILPINGFHSSYGWSSGKIDEYHVGHVISDLERALNYLDKGEVVFRVNLHSNVKEASESGKTKIEFTYFTAQFYKKGTCHIKFREEAAPLIDRLNIFAAREKNWLPPNYGVTHYDDLGEEEKTVIDSFQGREEYEKVVLMPSQYILNATDIKYLPGTTD